MTLWRVGRLFSMPCERRFQKFSIKNDVAQKMCFCPLWGETECQILFKTLAFPVHGKNKNGIIIILLPGRICFYLTATSSLVSKTATVSEQERPNASIDTSSIPLVIFFTSDFDNRRAEFWMMKLTGLIIQLHNCGMTTEKRSLIFRSRLRILFFFSVIDHMFLKWPKKFKSIRSEMQTNEKCYAEIWYNCGTNDRNVSVTKMSQQRNDRNVSEKKKRFGCIRCQSYFPLHCDIWIDNSDSINCTW